MAWVCIFLVVALLYSPPPTRPPAACTKRLRKVINFPRLHQKCTSWAICHSEELCRVLKTCDAVRQQICCSLSQSHSDEMVCGKICYADFNGELMERFIGLSSAFWWLQLIKTQVAAASSRWARFQPKTWFASPSSFSKKSSQPEI